MELNKYLIKLKSKPLSWSAIGSWQYSKKQWAKKYLEGINELPNEQMKFGNYVGNRIATDPDYLPAVLRYDVFEKKFTAKIGKLDLIGYLDSYHSEDKHFYEYKTSSNEDKWNHKSANEHGQILFYLFLIWKNHGVPPEEIDIKLFYIPVATGGDFKMYVVEEGIKNFDVKHTTMEVLNFAKYITDTYKEMEKFALAYNPL